MDPAAQDCTASQWSWFSKGLRASPGYVGLHPAAPLTEGFSAAKSERLIKEYAFMGLVRPAVVVEAEYRQRNGAVLRRAVLKGVRPDQPARQVVRPQQLRRGSF